MFTSKDVFDMRNRTGFGLQECKMALEKLDGDEQAATNYLRLKGDCTCRRNRLTGAPWTDEDYIRAAREGY